MAAKLSIRENKILTEDKNTKTIIGKNISFTRCSEYCNKNKCVVFSHTQYNKNNKVDSYYYPENLNNKCIISTNTNQPMKDFKNTCKDQKPGICSYSQVYIKK